MEYLEGVTLDQWLASSEDRPETGGRATLSQVEHIVGQVADALGLFDELYVIAAAVIGGTNLMGGEGGAYGGFIGAALIFLIRNSLIMFGVEANWYDLFVGLFIILAVLLERIRGRSRG